MVNAKGTKKRNSVTIRGYPLTRQVAKVARRLAPEVAVFPYFIGPGISHG